MSNPKIVVETFLCQALRDQGGAGAAYSLSSILKYAINTNQDPYHQDSLKTLELAVLVPVLKIY